MDIEFILNSTIFSLLIGAIAVTILWYKRETRKKRERMKKTIEKIKNEHPGVEFKFKRPGELIEKYNKLTSLQREEELNKTIVLEGKLIDIKRDKDDSKDGSEQGKYWLYAQDRSHQIQAVTTAQNDLVNFNYADSILIIGNVKEYSVDQALNYSGTIEKFLCIELQNAKIYKL